MCDAACQHVMTKHRSAFRSTQPCSAPLNLSLSAHSFPPFPLFLSASPLPRETFSPLYPFLPPPPPPPSVKLLFFCAALTHSSSTLKRGRRGKQKGRGWKGKRKKRGEELVRKLETRVRVIFYLIVVEKGIGGVSQQRESWEIKGKQTVTEMKRLRNSERMKATDT